MKKFSKFLGLLFVLLLAGCSAKNGLDDYNYEPQYYESKYAQSSDEALIVSDGPIYVREHSLSITANDFDTAQSHISTKVNQLGGTIKNISIRKDSYFNINCQIPCEKVEEFMTYIETLGEVENSNEYTYNVTSQYIELNAKLDALEEQLEELNSLSPTTDDGKFQLIEKKASIKQ